LRERKEDKNKTNKWQFFSVAFGCIGKKGKIILMDTDSRLAMD